MYIWTPYKETRAFEMFLHIMLKISKTNNEVWDTSPIVTPTPQELLQIAVKQLVYHLQQRHPQIHDMWRWTIACSNFKH